MQLIPIGKITVPPNRFRKQFDPAALEELVQDIVRGGLLQPIVTRQESGQFFLVAGERRLRALADMVELGYELRCGGKDIERGLVPCIDIGELTELQRREAEYAENAVRKDFTWQENVAALAALAELRSAQAAAAGTPAPTTADIAKEVRGSAAGWSQDQTRKELIVSKHLDDPDVAAAASAEDAFKILKKKEIAQRNADLAAAVGPTLTAKSHTILNEDCLAWLEAADPNQFDVILTDPPYGMGADEFGDSGGRAAGAHNYADDADTATRCMHAIFTQGYRVTREQAHLYMFLDIDWLPWAKTEAAAAGWKVHRTPLIWHKPNGMRMPWPKNGPQRRYEIILYAMKGDMPIQRIAGDVLEYRPDENLGHGAQKPVALYIDLLSRSVVPGMRVLDPFAGTGPIIPAAHELQCTAVAIERDAASYGIAVKRVELLSIPEAV